MSASPENNNMVVATTSESDYTKLINTKLQESFKSVYESSCVATELSELKKKLNSLYEVKNSLKVGVDGATSNTELLHKTVDDLEKNIENKQKELEKFQEQFVASFLQVMENIAEHSKRDGINLAGELQKSLLQFGNSIKQQLDKQHDRLQLLEQNKMDNSVKDNIFQEIINVRSDMEKLVKNSNKEVADLTMKQSQMVLERVVGILKKFHQKREGLEGQIQQNLTTKLQERIEELKQFLTTHMGNLQKENKDFFANNLPEKIAHVVKQQLTSQTMSTKIQNIITSLPEYKALQENSLKYVTHANVDSTHVPSFEAIKTSIAALQQQITELSQSNQQTKSIIDTMRLPASAIQDPNQFDHAVAVKRMEEMTREVNVIYNHVKMIETMVNLKTTGLEEQVKSVVQVGNGRKRARTEEGGTIVTTDADNNNSNNNNNNNNTAVEITTISSEEYFARLTEVENKHQKLLDFILQCKDGVLDDLFPTRLEAAMAKIEQVLLNHEKFISFLIDPFTTASNTSKSISIPNNTTPSETATTLNPAMIDAIQQLVKAQAEEISLPLQKKIKLLEEKLEARSQQ